jgi:hypothetical protein
MFESWRAPGADPEPTGGIVAVLQRELLVPVDDAVAQAHLEAMTLEFELHCASFAGDDRRPRKMRRAVLGSVVAAGVLTFTGGVGAAGALPAPAQHWLSGVTRVFGIHVPDRPPRPLGASDQTAPAPSRPAPPPRAPHSPTDLPEPSPSSVSATEGSGATQSATSHRSPQPASGRVNGVPSSATPSAPSTPANDNSNAGGDTASAGANNAGVENGASGDGRPDRAASAGAGADGNVGGNGNAGGIGKSAAESHPNGTAGAQAQANDTASASAQANDGAGDQAVANVPRSSSPGTPD